MTMTPVARSNATPLEPAYLERAEFSKPSSFAAAEAERHRAAVVRHLRHFPVSFREFPPSFSLVVWKAGERSHGLRAARSASLAPFANAN